MNENVTKDPSEILCDHDKLIDFANLNRLSVEAAQAILQRLIEKPEIAEEVKEYISSGNRSEDFKAYTAGEATGYSRGHDTGFVKGAMLGMLVTIGTLTAAGLFSKK